MTLSGCKLRTHGLIDQVAKLFKSLRADGVVHEGATPFTLNQPGLAQYSKMLRNRRLCDRQFLRQRSHAQKIAAVTGTVAKNESLIRQQFEKSQPRGVSQGFVDFG